MDEQLGPSTKPISVTLSFNDWCLMISVLSSIIETTIEHQDPQIKMQVGSFARIRETIDRATD
jgi:hypothetical protein